MRLEQESEIKRKRIETVKGRMKHCMKKIMKVIVNQEAIRREIEIMKKNIKLENLYCVICCCLLFVILILLLIYV